MWLVHVLRRNRQRRPDALAVADAQHRRTWRELDERTDALACALLDRGLRPGDRLAAMAPNRVELLELYFAAAKARVVVCPLNPGYPAPEVEYIVGNIEPSAVFAEPALLDRLGPAFGSGWQVAIGSDEYERMATGATRELPLPTQDDLFALLQTSATTGRPKAVMIHHRSIAACYTGMAADGGFGPDDIMLNPCPLFHGSMVIGLALLAAGGALVVQREFSPQRFLSDVVRLRATRAFLVPAMVGFTMRARAFGDTDLSSLREVMYGGAPITADLLHEALNRFPCEFRNVYGITEGGGPIATLDTAELDRSAGLADPRLASAGRMLPGAHIEIRTDDGALAPAGTVGEVCVRGDGAMLGYWRNPDATAEVLADGWLRTGDLGYADPAGYLYLVDRRSDMIIRGGQNVYPAEIERVLRTVDGVVDACVVGTPSTEWGEVPVAFIVAGTDPPGVGQLLAACTAQLASYKRPTSVRFVAEIPRSPAGKVLRRVLRDTLTDNSGGG